MWLHEGEDFFETVHEGEDFFTTVHEGEDLRQKVWYVLVFESVTGILRVIRVWRSRIRVEGLLVVEHLSLSYEIGLVVVPTILLLLLIVMISIFYFYPLTGYLFVIKTFEPSLCKIDLGITP
uniref:Putative ovule protein n=1 Tax=Solanum chacoense TaxID=4108 RepID=A0A0V0HAE5_SOLCH